MRARGLVSALLVAAFALMPLSAFAQIARQADPSTFTPPNWSIPAIASSARFRAVSPDHRGGVQPLGSAQRLYPGPGGGAAPSSAACATARARSTPAMPASGGCSGRAPRSASTSAARARAR